MKAIQISGGCLTLIILFLIQSHSLCAQAMQYDYDLSGNRILKDLVDNEEDEEIFEPEQYRKKLAGLGIESEGGISYYPNPVRAVFNLELNISNLEQVQLELINAQGISLKNWTQLSALNKLDLSFLAKGAYLFKLQTKDHTRVFQILKQ